MRLRNNPEAKNILSASKYIIKEKKSTYFSNNNPVHIEIGMGKGDFIIGMAQKYPDINYVGLEKFDTVMVKALEKIESLQLENVALLNIDAKDLLNYFDKHTIGCIYLNFSDPWPKKRHYKRRLTYKDFLSLYQSVLIGDGLVKQKTDNKSLFESSLISFNQYPCDIEMISVDLHNSEFAYENVMSEYEKKFSSLNQPIYAVNVKFRKEVK